MNVQIPEAHHKTARLTGAEATGVKRVARDVERLQAEQGREQALRHAMRAIEPLLASPSDELRLALRDQVFRQIKGAQYQANDFESVDYNQFELSEHLPLFRGPKPSDEALAKGDYFCVLGAAQTFGRLVKEPWPDLISKAVGLPVLNLSRSGAGPDFFFHEDVVPLVQRAKFVVLQVLSGRSIGCSEYPGGRRIKTGSETVNRRVVLERLLREDRVKAVQYVRRWNEAYLATYRELRNLISRPAALLWVSSREPCHWEPETLLCNSYWGSFPQLVGAGLYAQVAAFFAYRAKVVAESNPERPVSRITGKPCPYIGTERGVKAKQLHADSGYYPSSETHVAVAKRLETWAKNRAAQGRRVQSRPGGDGASPLNQRPAQAIASVRPVSAVRQTLPE